MTESATNEKQELQAELAQLLTECRFLATALENSGFSHSAERFDRLVELAGWALGQIRGETQ